MLTPMKNSIILCVIFLSCIFSSTLAAGQNKTGWLNDKVTIRFQEESMSAVLGGIAQQTGIAILYDEKLAGQKVTGYYKNVKFSEAINRLFSEKNKSIQVFKSEKKIVVKTFGAKQFILATSGKITPDQPVDEAETMTVADLEKMHKRQYKEYKERIADDNEIITDDKLTRAELRKFHKKQLQEIAQREQDPNYRDPFSKMARSEVQALHAKQYREIQENEKNKKIIDIFTGMSKGDIEILHKRQANELRVSKQDDPFSDQTPQEIKALHAKQYKELMSDNKSETTIP
ncbi:hypothetical protein H206_02390 [Candidatus Electrothrix aarhusensis]|uniref:Secretin/TonB short N-terminal domain-containing protein n=1 Tax=Candidatus Electrothrix aarhusensis TaxID=1859131 RepID=A0A3S3SL16_9BACT|nr:hypothetical protein H206_02390 [Candidatus Electrothrix aarhusensis]